MSDTPKAPAPTDGAPPPPDLTTAAGVRAYLAATPFASTEIEALTGGTANYVFRVRLDTPYAGHATLVLKHARAYVKDYPTMQFDLGRQAYEVAALRHVHGWLPNDAIVTVPEVFHFDDAAHVIIMEDTGAGSTDLKTYIKTGRASREAGAEIGRAVGAFLGALHVWGTGNTAVLAAVAGNAQARQLTAWAFYGRLVATLTDADGPPKLRDPPLDLAPADLDAAGRVAAQAAAACLAVEDTFVMGDFWPGNVMVRTDGAGRVARIYVVDWELAKAGTHGTEVGQFCAEMHLLARCYPAECGAAAGAGLAAFMEEYKRVRGPDARVVGETLVRWGAHMVVLGARVEWGDKALSRAVVTEGVGLVVYSGELGESVAGRLL